MNNITLLWQPLRTLSEFPRQWPEDAPGGIDHKKQRADYKLTSCPSIYIWGFVHQRSFIPYYVGKSNRPFERAMQHHANLRGGLYPIYHRNSLARFHDYKKHKADWTCPSGKIYSPDSPWALAEIFPLKTVQDEVQYMLNAFRFTYATWSQNQYSTRVIEEAVADSLQRQYLQCHVAKSKVEHALELCHAENELIQQLFCQTAVFPRRVQMP